jgi:hypothetical protein
VRDESFKFSINITAFSIKCVIQFNSDSKADDNASLKMHAAAEAQMIKYNAAYDYQATFHFSMD